MQKIIYKEQIAQDVYLMRVEAPLIAEERQPGQFVIVLTDPEFGERIPLTIADADVEEGSITLVFQALGQSTKELAALEPGDSLAGIVGPLGNPTEIEKVGTVVCVGGGIGVAPLHPLVKAYREAGNSVISIIGARSRELVILEEQMRKLSDELIVCTDDGSYGRKGVVTEPLKEVCERAEKPDLAVAIGPAIMMKFCAETTKPYRIPTLVSLNTIMVDGTGMCGGCRITVGGETKFVCVDGPEFDGHAVDFGELLNRLGTYRDQEENKKKAVEHECKLDNEVDKQNAEKSK
ncbi:MAG: sulfide/dihydroorotate dehydrogenase-like FAD/NAD-binding protein [Verrucomicrobiota bacterium]